MIQACDSYSCSGCGYATTTVQACPCDSCDLPTCPGCGTEMTACGGPCCDVAKGAINWANVLKIIVTLLSLFGILIPTPPATPKTSK